MRKVLKTILAIGSIFSVGLLIYTLLEFNSSDLSAESVESRGFVTNVIDGDTIDVLLEDGDRERVRLLGIDAPEIDWEEMVDECYGFEAKERLTELAKDRSVLLVSDPSQQARDRYDRLLSFVRIADQEDGQLVNLTMVEEGYARQMIVGRPSMYHPELIAAEFNARESQRGLWAECIE